MIKQVKSDAKQYIDVGQTHTYRILYFTTDGGQKNLIFIAFLPVRFH
jgi:hypothetical protein